MKDLQEWLRKEANKRLASAISRRGYARCDAGLSPEDREAAHHMAELMCGRKLPREEESESLNSSRMQESIASKLEAEAHQLNAWANDLGGLLK